MPRRSRVKTDRSGVGGDDDQLELLLSLNKNGSGIDVDGPAGPFITVLPEGESSGMLATVQAYIHNDSFQGGGDYALVVNNYVGSHKSGLLVLIRSGDNMLTLRMTSEPLLELQRGNGDTLTCPLNGDNATPKEPTSEYEQEIIDSFVAYMDMGKYLEDLNLANPSKRGPRPKLTDEELLLAMLCLRYNIDKNMIQKIFKLKSVADSNKTLVAQKPYQSIFRQDGRGRLVGTLLGIQDNQLPSFAAATSAATSAAPSAATSAAFSASAAPSAAATSAAPSAAFSASARAPRPQQQPMATDNDADTKELELIYKGNDGGCVAVRRIFYYNPAASFFPHSKRRPRAEVIKTLEARAKKHHEKGTELSSASCKTVNYLRSSESESESGPGPGPGGSCN